MGNVYAALVQHVGSMQAACNPHNPHVSATDWVPNSILLSSTTQLLQQPYSEPLGLNTI